MGISCVDGVAQGDTCLPLVLTIIILSAARRDCWSMLAMCMVLLPIGNRILRTFPNTTQAIYADDLNFVSPTPNEALQVRQMWHEQTSRIGLKENVNKEQFLHRNQPIHGKLVKLGLPAASLQDATCILGFNMMPAQRRTAAGKETDKSSRVLQGQN